MSNSRLTLIALCLALLMIILPNIVLAEPSIQELVAGVDEKALHAALHESSDGKYKHGVFEGDTNALEAVHRSNPVEATRIIQIAKRQSNGTIPGVNTIIKTTHIASVYTSTAIAATFTTTFADGERQTFTSLIVVQATDAADQNTPPSGTSSVPSTTTGKPSLQTNAGGKLLAIDIQKLLYMATAVGVSMIL